MFKLLLVLYLLIMVPMGGLPKLILKPKVLLIFFLPISKLPVMVLVKLLLNVVDSLIFRVPGPYPVGPSCQPPNELPLTVVDVTSHP